MINVIYHSKLILLFPSKMPPATLETFLTQVEAGYCKYKNPYHNNVHAADVLQTMHYMLSQTGLMVSLLTLFFYG